MARARSVSRSSGPGRRCSPARTSKRGSSSAAPLQAGAKTVIGELVTAVDRGGRYVPGGTCLPKSLALAWFLRRWGSDANVCIGTRKDNGRFEAHAWVEVAGVAINEAPPGYAALVN